MKTIQITLAMLFISFAAMSQKEQYYQAMGESLSQYATCKSMDDFQALGNKFSMIAKSTPDEWLPLYYHAHCYIIMSFMEPSDMAKKDALLDAAEISINKMLEIANTEADVYALQAMLYSGRLMVSPMDRGQKYGPLASQAAGTAIGIDPSNPRARLIKLQNDMGTARFFGQDPKTFCNQAKELVAGWDGFKPKSPLHPDWGKQQAVEIAATCN